MQEQDPFDGIENDPDPPPSMLDPDPGAFDREARSRHAAEDAPESTIGKTGDDVFSGKIGVPDGAPGDATRLVRIKPYSKRRRQLTRRYTVFGVKFEVHRGWYRVQLPVADYLRDRTTDGHPDSPLIFDVCTEDQALEMEEKERRRAMELAGMGPYKASEPREMGSSGLERMGALTTHDLRHGYDSKHDRRRRTASRE